MQAQDVARRISGAVARESTQKVNCCLCLTNFTAKYMKIYTTKYIKRKNIVHDESSDNDLVF